MSAEEDQSSKQLGEIKLPIIRQIGFLVARGSFDLEEAEKEAIKSNPNLLSEFSIGYTSGIESIIEVGRVPGEHGK